MRRLASPFVAPPRHVIRLRAHTTKRRRADAVDIFPPLLESLRAAKGKGVNPINPVVVNVPSMKAIKADLAIAKIDYENDNGFADFHSLRLCCNTWMATQGASLSARQKHLRHTDPRLTAITYLDQMHISAASELFPAHVRPRFRGTAGQDAGQGCSAHRLANAAPNRPWAAGDGNG